MLKLVERAAMEVVAAAVARGTPASYTTNSGTGVDIHVTYDSSVGNAPAGFTSIVQKVADFFANSFQDSTHITINIDVGYGEVDGMRMGIGALGESVTNLQGVSYSNLTSAYSATGIMSNLGSGSNERVTYMFHMLKRRRSILHQVRKQSMGTSDLAAKVAFSTTITPMEFPAINMISTAPWRMNFQKSWDEYCWWAAQ